MADFRKWILALTVLALVAGLASAQVNNGGTGATPLSCVASTSVPPQLRSEGMTELIGDIVLNCTGGTTPGVPNGGSANSSTYGSQIPTANVTVYLNGTVTSRLTSSSNSASEALLLIDEPGSGLPGYGPTVPLTVCTSANQSANTCPEYIGNTAAPLSGVNVPVQTNPCPSGVCATTTYTAGWNAWQGTVSGSSVTFFGVPVLAPGTTGTRVFRITNVRVNANGITGGGPIPASVVAAVAISGSTSVPVVNPQLTPGFITQSLSTSIRDFAGGSFSNATPGLTQPIQCLEYNGNGKLLGQANLQFSELTPNAFKTRVMPGTFIGPASAAPALNPNGGGGTGQAGAVSGAASSTNAVQNVPGYIYVGESGFIVPALTLGNNFPAGLADFGTRLEATFSNIPSGISVYVSTTNTIGTVAATQSTTYAVLVPSENSVENTSTGGTNTPGVTATGTTNNSGQGSASVNGIAYYQLPIVNGSAMAVYEIVNSYSTLNESPNFMVWISYTASPATNNPAPGTMTVNMAYAPNPTSGLFTAAQGAAASASLNIPRFADTSTAINIAQVTICQTALLFPFITNQNGFDTGMAIADTSVDPFGTAAQNGTCTLNWYSNATTSSNPAASTLGAGGVGSTTPIAGGTVVTALASTTVPGFQGYMIAVCNFQYAHGFAFVSDLGARQLAMGYLPLVMNQPMAAWRPTGIGEVLEH